MNRIDHLFEKAKIFYDNGDPSHDITHVKRVMASCTELSKNLSVDLEILLASAILHDLVNLPKSHPERLQASQKAAQESKALLIEVSFNDDEIAKIQNIIIEHSYSLGKKPSSNEAMILQDADKLDALGAIGIMRTVTCGALLGSNYYETTDPFAALRELDDKSFTIDHFFKKLLKLTDLMNTSAAKEEALKRTKFMNAFLDNLKNEINLL